MDRPYVHVAVGLLLGLSYAFINTQTDDWARASLGRPFLAFHAFVDRGIPVLAGALLGLAFHWLRLRSRLVHAEALRFEELRSRLRHVERDQAVWVVAASTLHELKNPLHVMGLLVDELEEIVRDEATDAREAAIRDLTERLRQQMERSLVPLDALRSLTRRGRLSRTTRPVGEIAQEIVLALRPIAEEASVKLSLSKGADAPFEMDAELVRIILDNLISNALEGDGSSSRRTRLVDVSIEADRAGEVRIVVSDDGPGLDSSRVETLFVPLRTEKSSGLGLGLPIARALARTLGGDLQVRSSSSPFTTSFELTLPLAATTPTSLDEAAQ